MGNVIDDGIIKYDRSNFTQCDSLKYSEYAALEDWRILLFKLNLIGEYPEEKVGFGNLSMASNYQYILDSQNTQFVISGTQTGKYPKLAGEHYTRVVNFDIEQQKIWVNGPIEASSEALTHAALYDANSEIKAIFHIHSKKIWQGMIDDLKPYTDASIPYGTLEMAHAVQRLIENNTRGIICMRGHADGVIAYGESLEVAGELILDLYFTYVEKKERFLEAKNCLSQNY